jgi:hypothetical protein
VLGEEAAPKLAEEDVVRRCVLGVVLEAGALEVLHDVRLAVFERLDELVTEGEAVEREPPVRFPPREEGAARRPVSA